MTRFRVYLLLSVAISVGYTPVFASPLVVASGKWRITADPEVATLTVAYDELGLVMRDVQLNLRNEGGLQRLTDWTVEQVAEGSLKIKTSNPRVAWGFDVDGDNLKISCTSYRAVLTAGLPAPPDRIPSRLLDHGGTPVDWLGTTEVQHTYGGDITWNQSYLPRENSEVMYFALGQVTNRKAHSLFDRKVDTAISFSGGSTMTRSALDPNLLELMFPVPGSAMVRVTPDYYTKVLGVPYYVPFDDSVFETAPEVWCSWTSYYADVRESDIVKNTDWLAENLIPYGFDYVQIDDGYDRGLTANTTGSRTGTRKSFPTGRPGWPDTSSQRDFDPASGWFRTPMQERSRNTRTGTSTSTDGSIVRDYSTPALDSSNPEVLEFLRHLFSTLDGWGFEYYKFDGEHAIPRYAPNVDISRLYAPDADPLEVYRKRVALIRDTIGPDVFVEGCPAGTPLNAIGYYNSTFAGDDVYNSWQGMYALFSSINANAFLNHILVYLMPGEGIEVGTPMTVAEAEKARCPDVVAVERSREEPLKGFGTTLPEARTLVSYVSLTGVVYPLASVMPELPEERVQLLKQTMPTLPILPTDLFSRGTDMSWDKFKHVTTEDYIHNYPEVLDLKVNAAAGQYDVVAVTNWRDGTASRSISLADTLGLDGKSPYVAFDFWNQRPLGTVRGTLHLDVDSHDTRVVQLRPLEDHPQLLGTSRHISGAQSIQSLGWDAAAKRLSLTSETVPGEPYSIWLNVPEPYRAGRIHASVNAGGRVAVEKGEIQGTVKLTIQGQNTPINWQIDFTAN